MKGSKLIDLLKVLTAGDLRKVQKMLNSPFFTSNKNLFKLFKLLRSFYPDFDNDKLDKHFVFKKIFPTHTYSDIKLRNLISELVGLIEDYFLYKASKENDIERGIQLLNIYKSKKLYHLFNRSLSKIEKEIQTEFYRDPQYYEQMLQITKFRLEYPDSNNIQLRSVHMEEWGAYLEQYYLLEKSRQRIINKSFKKLIQLSGKKEIEFLKEGNDLLNLYQAVERLVEQDDPKTFLEVKERFEKSNHLIRKNYQLELHSLLVNYAIRKMTVDDVYYNNMVLDLYKIGLKQGFYLNNNLISDITFFNIVVAASKAKDFIWAEGFIKSYFKFLAPANRVEIKRLSRSIFYFHKKEFDKSIEQIIKYQFKNFQFKILARLHFIRCYYELYVLDSSYFDLLLSQVENNERFFRRKNEITEEKRVAYFRYLNFVKRLAILRLNGKLKAKQQKEMYQELEKRETTISRSWLIEIIRR